MRNVTFAVCVAAAFAAVTPDPAAAWFGVGGGVGAGFHGVGVGYRGPGVGGWHAGAVGWGHVGCYACGVYHPAWHPWGTAAAVGTAAVVGAAVVGAAVGAAAASAPVVYAAPSYTLPIGSTVPTLPGGCTRELVSGLDYYSCGGTWYRPSFGSNGVFYTVVAAP
jgi:hypothetical protein